MSTWLLAACLVGGCVTREPETVSSPSPDRPPNILVLIADDVGVEKISTFDIGTNPPPTPNIDALARKGMIFDHVWSQPLCSPTRATILSGRYGFRTGVGSGVGGEGNDGPYPTEPPVPVSAPRELHEDLASVRRSVTPYRNFAAPRANDRRGLPAGSVALPAILGPTHATAAIGKWHLADLHNGWLEHPRLTGFQHFSVLMKNEPESYFSWIENVDGRLEQRTGYTPDRKVDDALAWLGRQDGQRPWFLWLAFNLAHFPMHAAPDAAQPERTSDPARLVDGMITELDRRVGRLLAGMDPEQRDNTIVVFLGDNGTTREAIGAPFRADGAKFTLYEGGLRVPLIFAGPGIPAGARSSALVNTTDLFATLAALTGHRIPAGAGEDSVSLHPYFVDPRRPSLRSFVFADEFSTGQGPEEGGFTIRDARYKLLVNLESEHLFDLSRDPYERSDLLADGTSPFEKEIVARLRGKVDELRAGAVFRPEGVKQ
ncbi:sulfatase-like hydrolase/transferase [Tsuneonella dongtanensis]|nr:sulfatase-like hydrolase/transferase [Tsuneonella dongtanensis]